MTNELQPQAEVKLAMRDVITNRTDRKPAAEELEQQLKFEQALVAASRFLLGSQSAELAIPEALKCLVEASGVSRSYIFKNFNDAEDGLCMKQVFEACAPGVPAEIHNPVLQHVVYSQGFDRWRSVLASGNPIRGLVRDFPKPERDILEPQGILSILVLPIFVGEQWWGFIGFDETLRTREFKDSELALLQTVSGMLGTFLTSKRNDRKMALFAAVVENSNDIVVVKDLELRVVATNQSFAKAAGHASVDTMIGKTDAEIFGVAPEIEPIRSYMEDDRRAQALAPDQYILREEPVVYSNGEVHIVSTKKYPIYDAQGNLIGTGNISVDITDRKRMEDALRENERRFRSYIEHAPYSILTANAEGRYVSANRKALEITGYSLAELLSMGPMDITAPEDREAAGRHFARILEKGFTDGVFRFVHKSGEIRSWVVLAVKISETEFVGFGEDITGKLAMQRQIEESEMRFRSILQDIATVAVQGYSMDGTVRYWNRASEAFYGYTEDEALGRSVLDLIIPPPMRDGLKAAIDKMKTTRQAIPAVELELQRKNGSPISVYSSHALVQVPGKDDELFCVDVDLTERKCAEEELRAANRDLDASMRRANDLAAQAERASEAKSEFLANMSHELRTPLNGVIGMTRQLMASGLSAEQNRLAEMLRLSSAALLNVIGNVLDFSKIEDGQLDLVEADFDLGIVMDETAKILRLLAESKSLDLVCDTSPDVPAFLRGDAGRLRQILINLVGNAVKFTEQGEVGIAVRLESQTDTQAKIRFEVRDTGIGIPKDKLDFIFTKFYQGDSSISRKYGGTGLGLAISKQLAHLMGGEMGVESPSTPLRAGAHGGGGPGSTFWFTAVFGRASAPLSGSEGRAERGVKLRELRVLLAEDDFINRVVSLGMLKELGCRVDVAVDGQEAVQAFEKQSYDVVLMDMQMPVMDGLEATRWIRAMEEQRRNSVSSSSLPVARVPIVALSASVFQHERDLCREAGMDDFLSKPIEVRPMVELLAKWGGAAESGAVESEAVPVVRPGAARLNVYDREALLDRVMGDQEMVKRITDGFLENIPIDIVELKEFIARGDVSLAGARAHRMKSAMSVVGGLAMSEVVFQMEKAAKVGDLAAIQALVPELDHCFAELKRMFL